MYIGYRKAGYIYDLKQQKPTEEVIQCYELRYEPLRCEMSFR